MQTGDSWRRARELPTKEGLNHRNPPCCHWRKDSLHCSRLEQCRSPHDHFRRPAVQFRRSRLGWRICVHESLGFADWKGTQEPARFDHSILLGWTLGSIAGIPAGRTNQSLGHHQRTPRTQDFLAVSLSVRNLCGRWVFYRPRAREIRRSPALAPPAECRDD